MIYTDLNLIFQADAIIVTGNPEIFATG